MKLKDAQEVGQKMAWLKELHTNRELIKRSTIARLSMLDGNYKSADYQFENDETFEELKKFALKINKMKIILIKTELQTLGVEVDDTENEAESGAEKRT